MQKSVFLIVTSILLFFNRFSHSQTFLTLHTFTAASGGFMTPTNNDGIKPDGLTLLNGIFYGVTQAGGSAGNGTIFSVGRNGSNFTNLHVFAGTGNFPNLTNSDGAAPTGKLVSSGNILYGITSSGGSFGYGTVFSVMTNGTDFTILHHFTGGLDGAFPETGLNLAGATLYGTTGSGGISGSGIIFAMDIDGSNFTNLYSFTAANGSVSTNGDGVEPTDLVLSTGMIYGIAYQGGAAHDGTLFALNTDGSGFTNLHNFTGGNDGANPSGLIFSGTSLYGATTQGGVTGNGNIFAFNTANANFTNIHVFSGTAGSYPYGNLAFLGNNVYGTTAKGGNSGNGTIFSLNGDGSNFTNLYWFGASAGSSHTNADGLQPIGGLIFSGHTLYGASFFGGYTGSGTIFSLTLPSPPQLSIARSGANVVLTWPTNATVYTLQCCPDLRATNWVTVSPSPVVVGGQNTVTNAIASSQMFYRLIQ